MIRKSMPSGLTRWVEGGFPKRSCSNKKLDDNPAVRIIHPALGVSGFARQHSEIDADFSQRPFVFAADVGTEDQVRIGSAMQPAVALNLAFQLTGSPAGVA